jgi:hypothetical protein
VDSSSLPTALPQDLNHSPESRWGHGGAFADNFWWADRTRAIDKAANPVSSCIWCGCNVRIIVRW